MSNTLAIRLFWYRYGKKRAFYLEDIATIFMRATKNLRATATIIKKIHFLRAFREILTKENATRK